MDGRIYDLLMKIDNIGVAKFGLKKDDRIFLKKLLIEESFLNKFIEINGGIDQFINKLNSIYLNLSDINNDINKIKKISEENEEFKESINKYFGKELEDLEKNKEAVLNKFINELSKEESQKKDEENKINEILKKLKE